MGPNDFMWLIPTFPAVPRDGQGADERAKVQGQPVCRLLSILFWVEEADFYVQEPSQEWMLQRERAVKVTEEWILLWPEKAIDKSLEMVGEKINVILYMQNTGSEKIMFAQGAPNAVAALRKEPLACSGCGPPTLKHTLIRMHHLN